MAGDGTSFQIDINVPAAGAEFAAAAVARLGDQLTGAQSAAAKAAEAVKNGEAAYKQAENSANKAALALEKIGIAAQSASGTKLQNLLASQTAAAEKALTAKAAMDAEAVALDRLKAAATGATGAHLSISKALDKAKVSAEAAAKAQAAIKGTGNLGKAASELGNLGGPLGTAASKALGLVDSFGDLTETLGSGGGAFAFAAVGVAAIAAAIVAATAAAIAGVVAITVWAVKLADTEGRLGKLGERIKKNFTKLFGGLNIKPLLGELEKIGDLFDEGTASANAIKTVFNSLFQPIVDGAAAFVPKLISAFIQFEILVMKALIAVKPFGAVFEAIGLGILLVVGIVAVVVAVFIAAGLVMVAAFAALIALPFYIVDLFKWLGGAISGAVGAAADWITAKFQAVMDWLSSLSLSEIATQLINGLIAGLTGGGDGVIKAITGVVGGAINAAKGLLGIASPSKVFAEIGGHTAEGMAEGVDDGAASVQGSMESMVAPPAAATGTASTSTSTTGGAVYHITITEAGFGIDALRALLSDLGAQAGTAVPSAA